MYHLSFFWTMLTVRNSSTHTLAYFKVTGTERRGAAANLASLRQHCEFKDYSIFLRIDNGIFQLWEHNLHLHHQCDLDVTNFCTLQVRPEKYDLSSSSLPTQLLIFFSDCFPGISVHWFVVTRLLQCPNLLNTLLTSIGEFVVCSVFSFSIVCWTAHSCHAKQIELYCLIKTEIIIIPGTFKAPAGIPLTGCLTVSPSQKGVYMGAW